MRAFLLFSELFKPLANKIKFAAIVISRFFRILFSRRMGIQLIQLDYSSEYLFDKSLLFIHYRFKNVLWYNFRNLKKTTKRDLIVFDLFNIKSPEITLIVYGLFQKRVYKIKAQPVNTIVTDSFKTNIKNINRGLVFTPEIEMVSKSTKLTLKEFNITRSKIIIKHSPYKQTNFL